MQDTGSATLDLHAAMRTHRHLRAHVPLIPGNLPQHRDWVEPLLMVLGILIVCVVRRVYGCSQALGAPYNLPALQRGHGACKDIFNECRIGGCSFCQDSNFEGPFLDAASPNGGWLAVNALMQPVPAIIPVAGVVVNDPLPADGQPAHQFQQGGIDLQQPVQQALAIDHQGNERRL